MNQRHLEFCASAEWADIVETEILPWAVGDLDLGDDVLEVGSGPGLTTDVLRRRVPRLTAVEIDPDLARSLKERLRDSNVQVIRADATRLPLESGRFSAATSFAMLHHVPSRELQDGLLAELCRVLRPGGLLVGSDAVGTAATPTCRATRTSCRAGSGRPATSTSGWSSASWARTVPRRAAGGSASAPRRPETPEARGPAESGPPDGNQRSLV
jgi:SAM-dependent methyltransferase